MPIKNRYGEFDMARPNPAFMSGVPELLVLRLLSRQEMYGYEVVQGIRLSTNDVIVLAEGVIYPTLHTLEKKGFLKAVPKTVDGRKRIYYQVTAKGKKRFEEISSEWKKISSVINASLERSYV